MTLLLIATWRGGEVTPAVGYDALRGTLTVMPRLSGRIAAVVEMNGAVTTDTELDGILTAKPG